MPFQTDYARHYDLFNRSKPYKKEIEFVHKWAGFPKTVMDIGCGTASYWKYYPEGTQIRGIEQSSAMANGNPNISKTDVRLRDFGSRVDLVTALFDVINYIPDHKWWRYLPLEKGGQFIFDIWDKEKCRRDGFRTTFKRVGTVSRIITPEKVLKNSVNLKIDVSDTQPKYHEYTETHTLYLYSHKDIEKFCGRHYEIAEVQPTRNWQTWYRLVRK